MLLPQLAGNHLLWNPANTGPVIRKVRRQVSTIHDLTQLDPAINPKTFKYYRWLISRLVQQSQGILTDSEFSKNCILEEFKCSEKSVVAIPLGVDHDRFRVHSEKEIELFRSRFKLGPGYLLTLGSTSPRKNLVRMIEAWSRAQDSVPKEAELIIAGDLSKESGLQATLPPRTRLIGRVSDQDLPPLLASAGAFIFPSLSEGFGLPPLEAMACGTPCIVSNTTSLPEVVGDDAAPINPLDVGSMAEAIISVLTDAGYQKQLRSAGLARSAGFTWDKATASTADFLSRF